MFLYGSGILTYSATDRAMAFVRYKTVKGRKYYQYVRNHREGGRHKQEVLCHLGPHDSLEGAIAYEKNMLLRVSKAAARWEEEAGSTKGYLLEFYGDVLDGEIPSADAAWDLYWEGDLLPWGDVALLPEGEQQRARIDLWERERDLYRAIIDYHNANQRAVLNRSLAQKHQAKLNELIDVQERYS